MTTNSRMNFFFRKTLTTTEQTSADHQEAAFPSSADANDNNDRIVPDNYDEDCEEWSVYRDENNDDADTDDDDDDDIGGRGGAEMEDKEENDDKVQRIDDSEKDNADNEKDNQVEERLDVPTEEHNSQNSQSSTTEWLTQPYQQLQTENDDDKATYNDDNNNDDGRDDDDNNDDNNDNSTVEEPETQYYDCTAGSQHTTDSGQDKVEATPEEDNETQPQQQLQSKSQSQLQSEEVEENKDKDSKADDCAAVVGATNHNIQNTTTSGQDEEEIEDDNETHPQQDFQSQLQLEDNNDDDDNKNNEGDCGDNYAAVVGASTGPIQNTTTGSGQDEEVVEESSPHRGYIPPPEYIPHDELSFVGDSDEESGMRRVVRVNHTIESKEEEDGDDDNDNNNENNRDGNHNTEDDVSAVRHSTEKIAPTIPPANVRRKQTRHKLGKRPTKRKRARLLAAQKNPALSPTVEVEKVSQVEQPEHQQQQQEQERKPPAQQETLIDFWKEFDEDGSDSDESESDESDSALRPISNFKTFIWRRLHLQSVKQSKSSSTSKLQIPNSETRPSKKAKHEPFTEEETQAIITGVQKFGVGKWKEIKEKFADVLKNRTPVNIKDKVRNLQMKNELCIPQFGSRIRQTQSSSPKRKQSTSSSTSKLQTLNAETQPRKKPRREPFTEEETQAIITGVQKFGMGKWKEIKKKFADVLKNRTPVNIKDKVRNLQRKNEL